MGSNGLVMPAGPSLPGVEISSLTATDAPIVVVVGGFKTGKSCLAPTLNDWPKPGGKPIVLAWDDVGPDACAALGYPVEHYKMKRMPGRTLQEKANHVLTILENAKRSGTLPNTTIVTDCISTFGTALFDEAKQQNPHYKDSRKYYGDILPQLRSYFNRVKDLGLPSVWLAWQMDPTENRMGGPNIPGAFKDMLPGIAHMVLVLELRKIGQGQPGADQDGNIRLLHTRPWAGIMAGGRYRLPEPLYANLAYVFDLIMGRVENPAFAK